MKLKNYRIDTSTLTGEAQDKAMDFIETNAFTSAYIPGTNGCYECTWEDNVNLSSLSPLSGCKIQELL